MAALLPLVLLAVKSQWDASEVLESSWTRCYWALASARIATHFTRHCRSRALEHF